MRALCVRADTASRKVLKLFEAATRSIDAEWYVKVRSANSGFGGAHPTPVICLIIFY